MQATYSPAEAAQLRRSVTLQNWDDGGDVSRFVYLHTSEIFPSAVIHRSGPVSDLAVAPDPRIGAYRVKAENGREEDLNRVHRCGPRHRRAHRAAPWPHRVRGISTNADAG